MKKILITVLILLFVPIYTLAIEELPEIQLEAEEERMNIEGGVEKNRNLDHYNLQMIIAVGFKVNNPRAVQFRKWAGQIVKDYTIQGWVMDSASD